MNFKEWEPFYERILKDMGFSREDDEHAALVLSSMLHPENSADISVLSDIIKDRDILVCGNGPCLGEELRHIGTGNLTVIAADGATTALIDKDIIPNIIVTDLDGDIGAEVMANKKGSLMIIHAHGDNIDRLKEYVPLFTDVIGSTQAEPLHNVHNFGGFSDGDRCVYVAKEFGAATIKIIGFDLDDENVDPLKKKKLEWARILIDYLDT